MLDKLKDYYHRLLSVLVNLGSPSFYYFEVLQGGCNHIFTVDKAEYEPLLTWLSAKTGEEPYQIDNVDGYIRLHKQNITRVSYRPVLGQRALLDPLVRTLVKPTSLSLKVLFRALAFASFLFFAYNLYRGINITTPYFWSFFGGVWTFFSSLIGIFFCSQLLVALLTVFAERRHDKGKAYLHTLSVSVIRNKLSESFIFNAVGFFTLAYVISQIIQMMPQTFRN